MKKAKALIAFLLIVFSVSIALALSAEKTSETVNTKGVALEKVKSIYGDIPVSIEQSRAPDIFRDYQFYKAEVLAAIPPITQSIAVDAKGNAFDLKTEFNKLLESKGVTVSTGNAIPISELYITQAQANYFPKAIILNSAFDVPGAVNAEVYQVSPPATAAISDGYSVILYTWSEANGALTEWNLAFSDNKLASVDWEVIDTGVGSFTPVTEGFIPAPGIKKHENLINPGIASSLKTKAAEEKVSEINNIPQAQKKIMTLSPGIPEEERKAVAGYYSKVHGIEVVDPEQKFISRLTSEENPQQIAGILGESNYSFIRSGNLDRIWDVANVSNGYYQTDAGHWYDLTGDSIPDPLVAEHSSRSVLARNGANGVQLWRRTYNASDNINWFTLAGKLNNDAIRDAIVMLYNSSSYDSWIEALSGTDGTLLWTRTVPSQSYSIWSPYYDLNNDGRGDMVITNSTTNYTTKTLTGATTVVSGATGADIWTSSVSKNRIDVLSSTGILPDRAVDYGFIYANPSIGDVNNDGFNDTFVSVTAQNYSSGYLYNSTLEMRSGNNGNLLWSNYYFGYFTVWNPYSAGDITGDNIKDFILPYHTGNYTNIILLKGSDGTTQWNNSYLDYSGYTYALPLQDIDSDTRKDVLVTRNEERYISGSYVRNGELIAVKGTNGVMLWNLSFVNRSVYYLRNVPDANGDNVKDIFAVTYNSTNQTVYLLSGANGAVIWSREVGRYDGVEISNDLNNDAKSDALVLNYTMPITGTTIPYAVTALSGATGVELWSNTYYLIVNNLGGGGYYEYSYGRTLYFDIYSDVTGDSVDDPILSAGFIAYHYSPPYVTESTRKTFIINGQDGREVGNLQDYSDQSYEYYYSYPDGYYNFNSDGVKDIFYTTPKGIYITKTTSLGTGDVSPPSLGIVSPGNYQRVYGTRTIGVRVNDSSSIASVSVRIGNGSWTAATYNSSGGTWDYSWDTTTASNGWINISAKSTDSNGNIGYAIPIYVNVANGARYVIASDDFLDITTNASGTFVESLNITVQGFGANEDVNLIVRFYNVLTDNNGNPTGPVLLNTTLRTNSNGTNSTTFPRDFTPSTSYLSFVGLADIIARNATFRANLSDNPGPYSPNPEWLMIERVQEGSTYDGKKVKVYYQYGNNTPFTWNTGMGGTGTSQYINQPINSSTPHNFIAPFWDDLVTWGSSGVAALSQKEIKNKENRNIVASLGSTSPGAIYYQTIGTAPNRMFVVEWYNNQHYTTSDSGVTFEAILYEGNNSIKFQYKNVTFGTVYSSTSRDLPPYDNGGSATVGIEGPNGRGLQYSYNQQVLSPNLAILFNSSQSGYTFIDSNTSGGPAYNWIEINTTGTKILNNSDDLYVDNIPIGFSFIFYGTDASYLSITNNGLIAALSGNEASTADSFAQDVLNGSVFSYNTQIRNWGFVSPDTDGILRVFINNGVDGISAYYDGNPYLQAGTYAPSGNEVRTAVQSNLEQALTGIRYADRAGLMRVVTGHEHFHNLQYGINQWHGGWGWMTEGQARFQESVLDPNTTFINTSLFYAGYPNGANGYMSYPNRPLSYFAYDYALFWGYLYQNDGGISAIKQALNESNRFGVNDNTDGANTVSAALASRAHANFGNALDSFSGAVFSRNFSWGDSNGTNIKDWGAYLNHVSRRTLSFDGVNSTVNGSIYPWAIEYVKLPVGINNYTVIFNGNDASNFTVKVLLLGSLQELPVQLNNAKDGSINVTGAAAYSRAALAIIRHDASGTGAYMVTVPGINTEQVLADLRIAVSVQSEIQLNHTANISVTVYNFGSLPSNATKASIYDGNLLIQNLSIPPLNTSEYNQSIIPWIPASGGRHAIRGIVDPDNTTAESDEINNAVVTYTSVQFIDLVPRIFVRERTIVNNSETVRVVVRNIGGLASEPTTLELNISGPSTVHNFTVPSIPGGGQEVYTVTFIPTSTGTYTLRAAVADVNNTEANRANNEVIRTINVGEYSLNAWYMYYPYYPVYEDNTFWIGAYVDSNFADTINASITFDRAGLNVTNPNKTFTLYNGSYNYIWWEVRADEVGKYNATITVSGFNKTTVINTTSDKTSQIRSWWGLYNTTYYQHGPINVIAQTVTVKDINWTIPPLNGTDSGTLSYQVFNVTEIEKPSIYYWWVPPEPNRSLKIDLSAGAEGRMLMGLEYLFNYPNGCPEQTMSPTLGAKRVEQYYLKRGVLTASLNATLYDKVRTGVNRMSPNSRANPQQIPGVGTGTGGWAWGTGTPTMFYTVYTHYGMGVILNNTNYSHLVYNANINVNESARWIVNNQNSDGSWTGSGYINGNVPMTGFTMRALEQTLPYMNATMYNRTNNSLQNATAYLLRTQMSNGGWNQSGSSYYYYSSGADGYSTALALLGLIDSGNNSASVQQAISNGRGWLIANQDNRTGSWSKYAGSQSYSYYGDLAETTAYAAVALNKSGLPSESNESIKSGVRYLAGVYQDQGSWGSTKSSQTAIYALTELQVPEDVDTNVTIVLKDVINRTIRLNNSYSAATISSLPKPYLIRDRTWIQINRSELNAIGIGNQTINITTNGNAKVLVSVESKQNALKREAFAKVPRKYIDPIADNFTLALSLPSGIKDGDTVPANATITNKDNTTGMYVMVLEVPFSSNVTFPNTYPENTTYYNNSGSKVLVQNMYNASQNKLYIYPGSDNESQPSVPAGGSRSFYFNVTMLGYGQQTIESKVVPMYNDTLMAIANVTANLLGYGNVTVATVDENHTSIAVDVRLDGTSIGANYRTLEGAYSLNITNGSYVPVRTNISVVPGSSKNYTARLLTNASSPSVILYETTSEALPANITTTDMTVKYNFTLTSSGGRTLIALAIPSNYSVINVTAGGSNVVNTTENNTLYAVMDLSGDTQVVINLGITVIRGDVDGISGINLLDVIYLLNYVAGTPGYTL